jgi:hypothetical protein
MSSSVPTIVDQGLAQRDIVWLAGLLEGEGCFWSQAPRVPVKRRADRYARVAVKLTMTDKDVVLRAASLVGLPQSRVWSYARGRIKPIWGFALNGKSAMMLAMVLYPWLGQRRRQAVSQMWRRYCLQKWNTGANGCNSKLNEEQVAAIRRLDGIETQARIAYRFGVRREAIGKILRGLTWKGISERVQFTANPL